MDSIVWKALEFEHHEKSTGWFVGLTIALTAIFVFAIWSESYLFALLVPLMGFLIVHYAKKAPLERSFTIDGLGVTIDKQPHPFETLSSFWIFYDPPHVKELSLRSKQRFLSYIRIPLADQDPVEIRRLLMQYLPERRHRQSLVDDLARQLKF